jgi:sigma-B regulation protein RsbU (phosphoserine phosphatase)
VGAGYSSIIGSPRLAIEQFHEGDLLVLFSDGIPEARDSKGELFGTAGIIRTIERVGEATPETIAFEIERAVHEHIPDAAPDDDQTLIVIRRE